MDVRAIAVSVMLPLLGVGAERSARADDRDPAAASALFQKARVAIEAGHYETACPAFAESYRLDPSPGTLLNMANCADHFGQLSLALRQFTEGQAMLAPSDPRMAYVEGRIAKLGPRVPRLRIRIATPSPLTVLRDDVVVDASAIDQSLPVDPGRHVIVVRAEGRRDRTIVVDLPEGSERTVVAAPGEPLVGPPSEAPSAGAGEAPRRASPNRLPWIVGGVGLAGVVVAAIAGGIVLDDAANVRRDCPGHACPTNAEFDAASRTASQAKMMEIVSTAGVLVGVAGIGAAAFLWLLPPGRAPSRDGAWIAPWVGSHVDGVAVGGRFE